MPSWEGTHLHQNTVAFGRVGNCGAPSRHFERFLQTGDSELSSIPSESPAAVHIRGMRKSEGLAQGGDAECGCVRGARRDTRQGLCAGEGRRERAQPRRQHRALRPGIHSGHHSRNPAPKTDHH